MQSPEKSGVSLEAQSKLRMEDLVPDLEEYRRWEAIVMSLKAVEEDKKQKMSARDLLTMIQAESDLVLKNKSGLNELDSDGPGHKSFVGIANQLLRKIKDHVRSQGGVNSLEAREELCRSIDRLIVSFFKKRLQSRTGGFKSIRSRNRRVRAAVKSAQERIGGKIDKDYGFSSEAKHRLHPYEAVLIELESNGFHSKLKRIKEALDLLEAEENLDHIILQIEDVFDRPDLYPAFHQFLGENENMQHLRSLYAHAEAMMNFRDGGAENQVQILCDEYMREMEAEMEANLHRDYVAVWVGEAMHDDFDLNGGEELPLFESEPYLTPWVDVNALGIAMPWDNPEPIAEEVSAAVEEVLDERPSHEISMRDMARLLRMMVWERDTLTSRMVLNMNHKGTREGSFKWRECHFKVPEELRAFMRAVYEHPRTKGGIRHLQFYMGLWLESYMHWFEDEFHPDVYKALGSGAIDSGLEMNDMWVDSESPKQGFDDSNLMAIEADLPWPK